MTSWVCTGIGQLATMPLSPKSGEAVDLLGLISNAALVVADGRVAWTGPQSEIPSQWSNLHQIDLEGRAMLPGFVDCHTHVVYGGDRLDDFGRRSRGWTYEEILSAGGGIHTTVEATRAASREELIDSASARLERMFCYGTTTVEIKSGYGLNEETELKMLQAIEALKTERGQKIVSTYLGAHVVPKDATDRDAYVAEVIATIPKAAEAGAEFVDVFCERGAFDVNEARAILTTARSHNLGLKMHVEQLGRSGGAALGADLGALSVDHVDHATLEDLKALGEAGTTAVLLPTAALFLGHTKLPQAEQFRTNNVRMALATDCNPGSTPVEDLGLVAAMGCALMGMTPEEALRAITVEAAAALNLEGEVGTLEPGARADLAILSKDARDVREVPYRLGASRIAYVLAQGHEVGVGPGEMGSGEAGLLKYLFELPGS
jgi:imidazolonepropionase